MPKGCRPLSCGGRQRCVTAILGLQHPWQRASLAAFEDAQLGE